MNVLSISADRLANSAPGPGLPASTPQPAAAAAAETRAAPAPAAADDEASRTKAEQRRMLETELAAANHKLAGDSHEVRFEFDRDASRLVVRLVDQSTREVLRQYPSNEALRVARLIQSGKSLISTQA